MSLRIVNTPIATVGAGVLTAAAIIGQVITRSGPVGAFTDTTDTAVNIIASLRGLFNVADPINWIAQYINVSGSIATIAAGSGVTLAANTGTTVNIPAASTAFLLVSVTPAAGTVSITVLARSANN